MGTSHQICNEKKKKRFWPVLPLPPLEEKETKALTLDLMASQVIQLYIPRSKVSTEERPLEKKSNKGGMSKCWETLEFCGASTLTSIDMSGALKTHHKVSPWQRTKTITNCNITLVFKFESLLCWRNKLDLGHDGHGHCKCMQLLYGRLCCLLLLSQNKSPLD